MVWQFGSDFVPDHFKQSPCAQLQYWALGVCKTSMSRCNWPSHLPHSRYQFLAVNLSPLSRSHFFHSRDMAHQSESARFQALFEPALQAYEKTAGVSLAQHPLAIQLQSCDTIEAIIDLLQDQAQAFSYLQGSDRIMKSIKIALSTLSRV